MAQGPYGVITEQADYAGFNELSEQDQETYQEQQEEQQE